MINQTIGELKVHPAQLDIYGDEPVDMDLVRSIKQKGILQPLIVNENYEVLSGNRRWKAGAKAGLKTILVDVRSGLSAIEQESFIIESNLQRTKTQRQIGREAIRLKAIESERARLRQIEAQNNAAAKEARAVRENITLTGQTTENKGKATEIVGAKLGMSGKTVEKLIEVEQKIETLEKAGDVEGAKKLEKTLEKKSISAAHSTIKPKPAPKPREPIAPKQTMSLESLPVADDDLLGITEEWIVGRLWEVSTYVMRKLTGKSEVDARKILGRLTQDISKPAVFAAMAIAGSRLNRIREEKLEPIAYVRKIAENIKNAEGGNGNGRGNRIVGSAAPQPGKYAGRSRN